MWLIVRVEGHGFMPVPEEKADAVDPIYIVPHARFEALEAAEVYIEHLEARIGALILKSWGYR